MKNFPQVLLAFVVSATAASTSAGSGRAVASPRGAAGRAGSVRPGAGVSRERLIKGGSLSRAIRKTFS